MHEFFSFNFPLREYFSGARLKGLEVFVAKKKNGKKKKNEKSHKAYNQMILINVVVRLVQIGSLNNGTTQ